eukprot:1157499-Pelagomonas_calceolata.AAC.8
MSCVYVCTWRQFDFCALQACRQLQTKPVSPCACDGNLTCVHLPCTAAPQYDAAPCTPGMWHQCTRQCSTWYATSVRTSTQHLVCCTSAHVDAAPGMLHQCARQWSTWHAARVNAAPGMHSITHIKAAIT